MGDYCRFSARLVKQTNDNEGEQEQRYTYAGQTFILEGISEIYFTSATSTTICVDSQGKVDIDFTFYDGGCDWSDGLRDGLNELESLGDKVLSAINIALEIEKEVAEEATMYDEN